MNFKKNIITLSALLVVASGSFASELAESNSKNQTENEGRDCSSYRDFKLEPVGTKCVVKSKIGGSPAVHKRTTLTLKDGTRVKGIEVEGTGLIMEDEIGLNLCQSDTITRNGNVVKLKDCFDSIGNSRGAIQYCEAKGLRLPTIEELNLLAERGIILAFGKDLFTRALWSSSNEPAYFQSDNLVAHLMSFYSIRGRSWSTDVEPRYRYLIHTRCVSATTVE